MKCSHAIGLTQTCNHLYCDHGPWHVFYSGQLAHLQVKPSLVFRMDQDPFPICSLDELPYKEGIWGAVSCMKVMFCCRIWDLRNRSSLWPFFFFFFVLEVSNLSSSFTLQQERERNRSSPCVLNESVSRGKYSKLHPDSP